MTRLNGQRVPFDEIPPATVEEELRAQIARLHAERQDLRTAIDLLHRAVANLDFENADLRRQVDILERGRQKKDRWRPW